MTGVTSRTLLPASEVGFLGLLPGGKSPWRNCRLELTPSCLPLANREGQTQLLLPAPAPWGGAVRAGPPLAALSPPHTHRHLGATACGGSSSSNSLLATTSRQPAQMCGAGWIGGGGYRGLALQLQGLFLVGFPAAAKDQGALKWSSQAERLG